MLATSIEAVRVPEVEDETNDDQKPVQFESPDDTALQQQDDVLETQSAPTTTNDSKQAKLAATKQFLVRKMNQFNDTMQEQG